MMGWRRELKPTFGFNKYKKKKKKKKKEVQLIVPVLVLERAEF
jgi:hypothetical protein